MSDLQIIKAELQSKNGYDMICGAVYLPKNPKAVIQVVEGMCEHKGRYEDFINFLCSKGYACIIHDHAGQGKSAKSNDYLGVFALKHGYEYLIRDTYRFAKEAKKYLPNGLKTVIFGHSMGSFIARLCAHRFDSYSGMIISGTGGPNKLYFLGEYLLRKEIVRYGEFFVSNKLYNLVFSGYNRKTECRTEFDWISSDTKEVDKYIADPLCGYKLKVVGLKDVVKLSGLANSEDSYKNISQGFPIYIFSGTDDPVGNYGKGVQKVYKNYENKAKADAELKLYPSGRHEMLNEINRDEVYSDIVSWLERKGF